MANLVELIENAKSQNEIIRSQSIEKVLKMYKGMAIHRAKNNIGLQINLENTIRICAFKFELQSKTNEEKAKAMFTNYLRKSLDREKSNYFKNQVFNNLVSSLNELEGIEDKKNDVDSLFYRQKIEAGEEAIAKNEPVGLIFLRQINDLALYRAGKKIYDSDEKKWEIIIRHFAYDVQFKTLVKFYSKEYGEIKSVEAIKKMAYRGLRELRQNIYNYKKGSGLNEERRQGRKKRQV